MNDAPEADDAALAAFMEYFRKNYPGPETIIGRPDWHSPKIFRAARHALFTPEALAKSPHVQALVKAAVEAERERWTTPDRGFVCECGMTGPCMAENCKSPILDMQAAIREVKP